MSFAHLGGLGNGGWRGTVRIAQRQAPLRGEDLGELDGRLPSKARVRSFSVIVGAPCGQRDAGVVQRRKQCFIQQFVAQSAVEALDERILGRFARRDVVLVDLAVIGEGQDRVRGELGSITPSECR